MDTLNGDRLKKRSWGRMHDSNPVPPQRTWLLYTEQGYAVYHMLHLHYGSDVQTEGSWNSAHLRAVIRGGDVDIRKVEVLLALPAHTAPHALADKNLRTDQTFEEPILAGDAA